MKVQLVVLRFRAHSVRGKITYKINPYVFMTYVSSDFENHAETAMVTTFFFSFFLFSPRSVDDFFMFRCGVKN